MRQRICGANATRIDSGQFWNGMLLRYRGQSFFGNEIRNPVATTKQAGGDLVSGERPSR